MARQNTVIAVQAMSAVAGMFEGQVQDITISAQKDSFKESVNIQQGNAIVFNRFDVSIIYSL